jgi:hypothetical protein
MYETPRSSSLMLDVRSCLGGSVVLIRLAIARTPTLAGFDHQTLDDFANGSPWAVGALLSTDEWVVSEHGTYAQIRKMAMMSLPSNWEYEHRRRALPDHGAFAACDGHGTRPIWLNHLFRSVRSVWKSALAEITFKLRTGSFEGSAYSESSPLFPPHFK